MLERVLSKWYTCGQDPKILTAKCRQCGSLSFPPPARDRSACQFYCGDPLCQSERWDEFGLSSRGAIWSFTDSRYPPPAPYRSPDPYEPIVIAAVEFPEGIIILGQVCDGYAVSDLRVGMPVEVVVEPVGLEPGETARWFHRWRPVAS